MIVTVFRSRLMPGLQDEYVALVDRMQQIARTIPGYISHKGFFADDGERVTIVEFETEEGMRAWRMHPEHRVAWKALDQDGPNGVVTFHKLDEGRTKLMVQMDYEPEGLKESVGSAVGIDSRRVKGDLESFKEFIEGRAHETGAWRGNIEN